MKHYLFIYFELCRVWIYEGGHGLLIMGWNGAAIVTFFFSVQLLSAVNC